MVCVFGLFFNGMFGISILWGPLFHHFSTRYCCLFNVSLATSRLCFVLTEDKDEAKSIFCLRIEKKENFWDQG